MATLVLQSHRSPLPAPWYEDCRRSVKNWAEARSFEYRWLGDELFSRLPEELNARLAGQRVVASDLARLLVLEEALTEGYARVVWVDADVLVLDPASFELPDGDALFGREVWIQRKGGGANQLKVYRKIHNAFMAFCAGEPVLPFYRLSAERILNRYDTASAPSGSSSGSSSGYMVPQLIGPKLITLLHNAIGFDVLEEAGVLSPMVVRDLLEADHKGKALERFRSESAVIPKAVNLCGSSVRDGVLSDSDMVSLVERLQSKGFSAG